MGLGLGNNIWWSDRAKSGGISTDTGWITEDFAFLITSEDGENILAELPVGITEFILLESGGRVLGEQNNLNMIKE